MLTLNQTLVLIIVICAAAAIFVNGLEEAYKYVFLGCAAIVLAKGASNVVAYFNPAEELVVSQQVSELKSVSQSASSEVFNWVDDFGQHTRFGDVVEIVESDRYEVVTEEVKVLNSQLCEKTDYTRYIIYVPADEIK